MRKLVTIRTIKDLRPIQGADRIEVAIVDGWQVVVKKGDFQVGDQAVYFEVDSFLPQLTEFEFLSGYKKRMGDEIGYRLKTIRLRGQLSQGLLMPISILPDPEAEDFAESLGVVKYEPPIPAELAGVAAGGFPSFLRKTDEERVQNLEYDTLWPGPYVVTEKLDGTSCTYYLCGDKFGVCSRNWELEESDNTYWKVARDENIEKSMRESGLGNFALQGELIGEGIQGNKYKIKGQQFRLFKIWDINRQSYFEWNHFKYWSKLCNTVPTLHETYMLPDLEELLGYATGLSCLADTQREGLVLYGTNSFKVISNEFLLKNE